VFLLNTARLRHALSMPGSGELRRPGGNLLCQVHGPGRMAKPRVIRDLPGLVGGARKITWQSVQTQNPVGRRKESLDNHLP